MPFIQNENLFRYLAENFDRHSHQSLWWTFNESLAAESMQEIKPVLESLSVFRLGELEDLIFSFKEMGSINSLHLFGLDELILFAFYWVNKNSYSRVLDLGANIGLHTTVLFKMGYTVTSFEPDPKHMEELSSNLLRNGLPVRGLMQKAVTVDGSNVEFIRVLGNTTGSHVAGAKADPYGDLDKFIVESTPIAEAVSTADLVKMDVEGLEASLLASIPISVFETTDFLIEIGTVENAKKIFDNFEGSKISLFSQKINWQQVSKFEELPFSHREGSCFITGKTEMNWRLT